MYPYENHLPELVQVCLCFLLKEKERGSGKERGKKRRQKGEEMKETETKLFN